MQFLMLVVVVAFILKQETHTRIKMYKSRSELRIIIIAFIYIRIAGSFSWLNTHSRNFYNPKILTYNLTVLPALVGGNEKREMKLLIGLSLYIFMLQCNNELNDGFYFINIRRRVQYNKI
jgi:hypothetical protein